VSHRTGSVTIEHDGRAEDVARLARDLKLFDLPEATLALTLVAAGAVPIAAVDPRTAVSASLAGLGVYQLARGEVLGTGLDHVWHAYAATTVRGGFTIAAVMALLGAIQIAPGRGAEPGGVAVLLRRDGAGAAN
jgi:hypothetical protein